MQYQSLKDKINTLLINISYSNKKVVQEHIEAFVLKEEFQVKEGVKVNAQGYHYSFISVAGFIQIDKNQTQIGLAFPHNYPDAYPQIYILLDQDNYEMPDLQSLVNRQLIQVIKNEAQQTLVQLSNKLMITFWIGDKKNPISLLKEVIKFLNNPPIFKEKSRDNHLMKTKIYGNGNASNTDRFVGQVQDQVIMLQSRQNYLETAERDNHIYLSKLDFFNRNMPNLINNMATYENNIEGKVVELQKINKSLSSIEDIHKFLDINEPQKQKIKALARKQVMKESQAKLSKFLSTNLSEHRCTFMEYKSTIKTLYEKMFQAQRQFLSSCDSL